MEQGEKITIRSLKREQKEVKDNFKQERIYDRFYENGENVSYFFNK